MLQSHSTVVIREDVVVPNEKSHINNRFCNFGETCRLENLTKYLFRDLFFKLSAMVVVSDVNFSDVSSLKRISPVLRSTLLSTTWRYRHCVEKKWINLSIH
jgi:hypothetical protein